MSLLYLPFEILGIVASEVPEDINLGIGCQLKQFRFRCVGMTCGVFLILRMVSGTMLPQYCFEEQRSVLTAVATQAKWKIPLVKLNSLYLDNPPLYL